MIDPAMAGYRSLWPYGQATRQGIERISEIFLSYNRQDAEIARRFAEGLEREGFTVWWDQALRSGEAYDEVTEAALRNAKAVVVLWSQRSVVSRWVRSEATIADRNNTLVPAMIEPCERPIMFELTQTAELGHWKGEPDDRAWLAFVEDVAKFVNKPSRHAKPAKAIESRTASPEPDPAPIAEADRTPLLGVLPFDNLSSDEELTYFCDGVSEEIQRTVASSANLRVVARSSSFQFRGTDKSIPKVTAALGTSHLLDGTVRRSGSHVRISAELVDCATQSALWADRFDGDLDDVFTLQETIALAVAEALQVKLATPPQSVELEAAVYEEFLRARAILAEGDPQFDDSARRAVPILERVVKGAPDFAVGWELLASARADVWRYAVEKRNFARASADVMHAAKRALELDPKCSGAYVAMARLEPWGAYAKREEFLRKALAVAPHNAEALNDMSALYWSVGRFEEALRLAEKACTLNPMMPSARLHVAELRAYVGDYEGSVRAHQELHRIWPDNIGILLSLLNEAAVFRRWDIYEAALPSIERFEGWPRDALNATVRFAEPIRQDDMDMKLERLESYSRFVERTGTIALNLIEGISQYGLVDEAFALAERANFDDVLDPEGHRAEGIYPGTCMARWSSLNRSPRFIDLCYRLGLCDYWMAMDVWPACAEWVPYDFKSEVRRRISEGKASEVA
ncbi:TIR domain-containing protein [Qipengyuania sp. XHP0207]|uniref:TIR domain-containing protein n=1 Tax=Qipengyuania sp. XHP0207 TaxID=3038078 RepID=UPI00241D73D0|nr:TIR domain-containing protein [Qipengyuania sp. XHP0207]MDG5747601.1 TIR domain-containing protein [Qipengyuania sp. XHP0207]